MATKPVEPPAVLMVLESFVAEIDGTPVTFQKGQPIEPDHPAVKRWPKLFGALVFPHPIKRRAQMIAPPELRAD